MNLEFVITSVVVHRSPLMSIITIALLLDCGCGDLSEAVVNPTPAGGVLVTKFDILQKYSTACDAEWQRAPIALFGSLPDGTATWIEHPPQGVFIPSGTKANIESRQFFSGR